MAKRATMSSMATPATLPTTPPTIFPVVGGTDGPVLGGGPEPVDVGLCPVPV